MKYVNKSIKMISPTGKIVHDSAQEVIKISIKVPESVTRRRGGSELIQKLI